MAKNGIAFESKILASEAGNNKFQFLQPTNPYHAYYRKRVGDLQAEAAAPTNAATTTNHTTDTANTTIHNTHTTTVNNENENENDHQDTALALSTVPSAVSAPSTTAAGAEPEPENVKVIRTKHLEKPDDFKYAVTVPEGLSALDLDVIRATAAYAARHGPTFSARLLQKETNNPMFQFLRPTHSVHLYYHSLVQGTTINTTIRFCYLTSSSLIFPLPASLVPLSFHSILDPRSSILDPLPLSLHLPSWTPFHHHKNPSAPTVTQPPLPNPNPNPNPNPPTLTSAVAYTRVLDPPPAALARLTEDSRDRTVTLQRCLKRLEFDQALDRERTEAEEAAEKERIEMYSVDWQDFVVVETISFGGYHRGHGGLDAAVAEAEEEDLPPPLSLRELLMVRKETEMGAAPERYLLAGGEEGGAAVGDLDPSGVPITTTDNTHMDAEERAYLAMGRGGGGGGGEYGGDQDPRHGDPTGPLATRSAPAKRPREVSRKATGVVREEADEIPIRVVRDYRRELADKGMDATQYVVSPLTGEVIQVGEMAEHMRVSLLDPRWREQRAVMLGKMRETTRASDEEIAANLMTLAKTRPDIFATTEQELEGVMREAVEAKRIAGTGRAVVWDGVSKGEAAREQQREADKQKKAGTVPVFPRVLPTPMPEAGPEERGTKRAKK